MPRGDKSKYTDKQERKADHIAESYETKAVPEKEAERRAWAMVNKDDGGGKKSGGSGRGKETYGRSQRRAARLRGGGLTYAGRATGLGQKGGGDPQGESIAVEVAKPVEAAQAVWRALR